jgi:CRISPR system Cascade subunit CasD
MMQSYLLFRLYGPLVAWGDIAVGERRPAFSHPSKSGVLGLVAGALGLRRDREDALADLHQGYGYACRVDAPGTLLTDFHTVMAAPAARLKNKRIRTRRQELEQISSKDNPIVSRRDYREDALALACLWALSSAPYALERLAAALRFPVFVPYLGRKSCPSALPFSPTIVRAGSPRAALSRAELGDAAFLQETGVSALCCYGHRASVHWEGDPEGAHSTVLRRDAARQRRTWQFGEREEHTAPAEE